VLQYALDADASEWPYALNTSPAVCRPPTEISGTFSTSWRPDQFGFSPSPSSSLDLTVRSSTVSFDFLALASGAEGTEFARVNFFGSRTSAPNLVLVVQMPIEQFEMGVAPFHGFETFGILVEQRGTNNWVQIGFVGGGQVEFAEAGMSAGDPVEGAFVGRLVGP
jgi:hypothetical protein